MTAYRPQLARLVKAPPEGDDWLHEMKYDGYRIGALVRRGAVTLVSRNGNDWSGNFPEISEAVSRLRTSDALLDGEVVMVLPDGRTSFQALQNAFKGGSRSQLAYFVFDLLRLDGQDVRRQPLEKRKDMLRRVVGRRGGTRIRYSDHVIGQGAQMFAQACRLGLEGIVSKRRDAPHAPGRGEAWLKTKCALRQELVIGGFTDPQGSREGIGALLVGYYDADGALAFAGKVGTGFSVPVALDLRERLERLERDTSPFTPRPKALGPRVHWVDPRLVAEVAFSEWTDDGKVRHPSFQGLRRDKRADEVRREMPVEAARADDAAEASVLDTGKTPRARAGSATRRAKRAAAATPLAASSRRAARTASQDETVAGVRITHPDREIYPGTGITKLALARFYERIDRWVLPHVEGRPLTLVRCPEGAGHGCFYMKHANVWAPEALRRVRIPERKKVGEYLVADNLPALIGLVQMGVLEIHTWNSRVERLEQPDRLVFDLDPGEDVPWSAVVDAARLVRRVLEKVGLASFPKLTGGRGFHIVVPLQPVASWDECLAFSRDIAEALERRDPERFTTAFAKAGRETKILIDYLRNNRANTSVAAYSTRAREGAPVSAPLRWAEVTSRLDPKAFTVLTIERRLARLDEDPWVDYWRTRQRLSSKMLRSPVARS